MGSHRAVGRLKGSLGGWALDRGFDARRRGGALARRRPARFCRVPVRGGDVAARHVPVRRPHRSHSFAPRTRMKRGFHERVGVGRPAVPSGGRGRPADRCFSAGPGGAQSRARGAVLLWRRTTATSRSRSAIRTWIPSSAFGFDLSLRWRSSRASGEVTYFRNDISDYIFRRNMTLEEFEAREDEFVDRFGGREPAGHEHAEDGGESEDEELAIVEYLGADSRLQGVEAHADIPGHVAARRGARCGLRARPP